MNRILVVAAHPDDEALGCGGTIARHARSGDEIDVVFLADGVGSRDPADLGVAAQFRNSAAEKACEILGSRPPKYLGFPDNRMDSEDMLTVVKGLEAVIAEIQPSVVYTHHPGDLNIDHRVAHHAVLTACRPLPGSTVESILAFEVRSSSEWTPPDLPQMRPNYFVDVSGTLTVKQRALEAYAEEMRQWPHARSWEAIEALARHRGASVGVEAAEAFEIVRQILR